MKAKLALWVSLVWLTLTGVASAQTTTVNPTDVANMEAFMRCRDVCLGGKAAVFASCMTANAQKPVSVCGGASAAKWDRNLDTKIDRVDYDLAAAELWDGGRGIAVCYENGRTVPLGQCAAYVCNRTPASECDDADQDGLRVWQEALIGTLDKPLPNSTASTAQAPCDRAQPCASLDEQCVYKKELARSVCLPRTCTGKCTSFELVSVVQDNVDVILRVKFVYSPVPTTVLDLYLDYDTAVLDLVDARPLALLTNEGKTLQVRKQGDTAADLRLMVLSTTNTRPIPYGEIAELVFRRKQTTQTAISFAMNDVRQAQSIAPNPGTSATIAQLQEDDRWAANVDGTRQPNWNIPAYDVNRRLVLQYSFDNPLSPLDVAATKTGPELCKLQQECLANSSASICSTDADCTSAQASKCVYNRCVSAASADDIAKKTARYSAAQRGVTAFTSLDNGVAGPGASIDGFSQHVELPLTFNEPLLPANQHYSTSLWLSYDPRSGETSTDDVIFSHNNWLERTSYGLLARPSSTAGFFDLFYFEGPISDPQKRVALAYSRIAQRRWTHVAFSVDMSNVHAVGANSYRGRVTAYVDGQLGEDPTSTTTPKAKLPVFDLNTSYLSTSTAFDCPQLASSSTLTNLYLEGTSVTAGRAPEVMWFATAKNNLYGVERMDATGLGRRDLIRLPTAVAQQPDYHPGVDRIVYSSSASGGYEIWIANGDGSNPKRITSGFGNTQDGRFALRPRWAPSGAAIVFESNAFNIPAGDNSWKRLSHLYYITYDVANNRVAIPTQAGATVEVLDYDELLRTNRINTVRLTTESTPRNYQNVVWMLSPSATSGGELLVTTSDEQFGAQRVARLTIPSPVAPSQVTEIALPSGTGVSDSYSLLAGRRSVDSQGTETRQMFYKRESAQYKAESTPGGFALGTPVAISGGYSVPILYQPSPPSANCWDRDYDNVRDPDEDRNNDTAWDAKDCYQSEVRDIFLTYPAGMVPQPGPNGTVAGALGAQVPAGKTLFAKAGSGELVKGSVSAYVAVQVLSNGSTKPLNANAEIARINFMGTSGAAAASYGLLRRSVSSAFFVRTNTTDGPQFDLSAGTLETISSAAFSPDGTKLLLSGIAGARPVLALSTLAGTSGMQRLLEDAQRIDGLSWTKVERVYPCNWIGAYRNPQTGYYVQGFRGFIDEVRVHNYVRPQTAYASEAERGHERLASLGRDGQIAAASKACQTDLDCGTYELCNTEPQNATAKSCQTVTCSPGTRCARGQCTLTPTAADDDPSTPSWACTVECNYDSECFTRECLNGPCRFCSRLTNSCLECQERVDVNAEYSIKSTEGCPDQNSFMCSEGSCLSECYAYANGQSHYLCDRTTQYCKQGRCATFDWSWSDLSTMSLAGLGETEFESNPDTYLRTDQADQRYPVQIWAYGVEDYGRAPQILVQGQIGDGRLTAFPGWFDLGTITVHNRNVSEAGYLVSDKAYTLNADYPITKLRLRLVVPATDNVNRAATGYALRDDEFYCATGNDLCSRRAYGSRAVNGYAVGNQNSARAACKSNGLAGNALRTNVLGTKDCRTESDAVAAQWLAGGYPAVVVLGASFNGVTVTSAGVDYNTICSYQGTSLPSPLNADGSARLLYFGDPAQEISNQKTRFYPTAGSVTALSDAKGQAGVPPTGGILNCPFVREDSTGAMTSAELVYSLPPARSNYSSYTATMNGKNFVETKSTCVLTSQTSTEICYRISGNVSIDPLSDIQQVYRSLEFDSFTAFGWNTTPTNDP